MNQIKKYIERLKQLQSLYEVGQPQHNAFGIAIDEANEMLVKNCTIPLVIKSLPEPDEIRMKARELDEKDFAQWMYEIQKGNVL